MINWTRTSLTCLLALMSGRVTDRHTGFAETCATCFQCPAPYPAPDLDMPLPYVQNLEPHETASAAASSVSLVLQFCTACRTDVQVRKGFICSRHLKAAAGLSDYSPRIRANNIALGRSDQVSEGKLRVTQQGRSSTLWERSPPRLPSSMSWIPHTDS